MREFAENADISDEIIGFHAQQAVEKWLKALMASRGLVHQPTDIDRIGRELEMDGIELPLSRPRLAELTPFAGPLRYEEMPDTEPLDRQATAALVEDFANWVRAHLQSSN